MSANALTVRLTQSESLLVEQLCRKTGLTKSALIRHALKTFALTHDDAADHGLPKLGSTRFGSQGDSTRQSAQIKRVVRERLNTKCAR